MTWLIILGALITLIGVAGLVYCIWKSNRVRISDQESNEAVEAMQRLIPVHLASLCVSCLGLIIVVVGILL